MNPQTAMKSAHLMGAIQILEKLISGLEKNREELQRQLDELAGGEE